MDYLSTMSIKRKNAMSAWLFLFIATIGLQTGARAASLVDAIKQSTPSIVGIGLNTPIKAKSPELIGTGFVVGDGSYIVTNYHVVSRELDTKIVQHYVAMSGQGTVVKANKLELIGIDPLHDLAILKMQTKLPALKLQTKELMPAGTDVYFTGFPIGAVLGLYPATHRGMVAAVAPDVIPARNADQLTLKMLERLQTPFLIYQLDATAYPGNSGSPVFNIETNEVMAIINKVFVSSGKESALSSPSGISYAIPVKHLINLANRHNVPL